MFTFDTKDCTLLKQALQILKVEVVSVRATKDNNQVLFCCHNRNTGLLLLHKVMATVEADQEFGVETDRFLVLLSKGELRLNYNGNSLEYKSGNRSGKIETLKPFFEVWPNLRQTGIPVQSVLDEFNFLNLTSKYAQIFIFGGHHNGVAAVASGDSEHAVFMPLQSSSEFALPFNALHAAQRIFKENVHVIVDAGTVYFQTKTERSISLLRFGQTTDTGVLSLDAFGGFYGLEDIWSASVDAAIFANLLNDYKLIADAERTGIITLETNGTKIKVTGKTRHGEINLVENAQGDTGKVDLNVELLKDICKLEALVKIGVKQGGRVFSISNDKASYFCAVA